MEIHHTVVRLQMNSLFGFFMFKMLQISRPSEHSRKKATSFFLWILFPSLWETVYHLSNAYADCEAADQQLSAAWAATAETFIWQ